MKKELISEHIFLFPFSWHYNHKKETNLFMQHNQIQNKLFNKLAGWKIHDLKIATEKDYNEFVYFYKPIRTALYTMHKGPIIVRNYTYEKLADVNYFMITVSGMTYKLYIEEIGLKIYKTGIGLLSFTMRNTAYKEIEAIEAINSFSKGVYPPILPLSKAKEELFPDEIILHLNEACHIVESYKENYLKNGLKISNIIMTVLGEDFDIKVQNEKPSKITIDTILGNQMFCLCVYKNQEVLKHIQEATASYEDLERMMTINKKIAYHEADDIPEHIGSTYYLKNQDSIYGISRFALLCVTREIPEDRLYDQLVSLVLMQRATLLSLSNEIAKVSTLGKEEISSAISSIYEIYIQFINQLYFKEVTEDAQGAHIYEKLSHQLKINEELEQLNFEIDKVREYANLVEQAQSAVKVELLTIIGAALVIPSFVTSLFGMNILQKEINHWWRSERVGLWMNSYVLLPILVTVVVCTWNKKKTKLNITLKIIYALIFCMSIFIICRYGSGV